MSVVSLDEPLGDYTEEDIIDFVSLLFDTLFVSLLGLLFWSHVS